MYKQIIILRKDLKLGVGKLVSQGSHASLGSFLKSDRKIQDAWLAGGSKKVVLKVNSLEELKSIESEVRKAKIPSFLVRDAGLTQTEAGTVTALAIGPVEEIKIDKITRKLKLL